MRIITGSARGRRLRTPAGLATRPMLDAQKQRLFDVLGHRVEVGGVWDVFAGSGALGLEALSRGAACCTFVEHDRRAIACLRANIDACRVEARTRVLAVDAFRLDAGRLEHDAGLVFVDPPFPCFADRRAPLARLLAALTASPRLSTGATVVWRAPAKAEPITAPAGLVEVDRRAAGRSVLHFYERQ